MGLMRRRDDRGSGVGDRCGGGGGWGWSPGLYLWLFMMLDGEVGVGD